MMMLLWLVWGPGHCGVRGLTCLTLRLVVVGLPAAWWVVWGSAWTGGTLFAV